MITSDSERAAQTAQDLHFDVEVENFPIVVSKHSERLGGESKTGEEKHERRGERRDRR